MASTSYAPPLNKFIFICKYCGAILTLRFALYVITSFLFVIRYTLYVNLKFLIVILYTFCTIRYYAVSPVPAKVEGGSPTIRRTLNVQKFHRLVKSTLL